MTWTHRHTRATLLWGVEKLSHLCWLFSHFWFFLSFSFRICNACCNFFHFTKSRFLVLCTVHDPPLSCFMYCPWIVIFFFPSRVCTELTTGNLLYMQSYLLLVRRFSCWCAAVDLHFVPNHRVFMTQLLRRPAFLCTEPGRLVYVQYIYRSSQLFLL